MTPADRQQRRREATAVIELALDRHRRWCRTCRRALRPGGSLCERGRELLRAVWAAAELASKA